MNRLLLIIAIVVVVAVPVICFSQDEPSTNATIAYYDGAGKTVTVPVSGYVKLVLDHLTAFILTLSAVSVSVLGKFILMFLPAAKDPNSWLAKVIAILKTVGAATPEKHTDIAPIEDKLNASPRTNVILEPGVGMDNTTIPIRTQPAGPTV